MLLLASTSAAELGRVPVVELESMLATPLPKEQAFRLEGAVRGVVSESGLLALQDDSGTVLLQVPAEVSAVSVGQHIVIEANPGIVTRTFFGVQIENLRVVSNDGRHSKLEKSGSVFLESGLNPIHVDWFNGPAECELNLEYEGPGVLRQRVPDAVLWARPRGSANESEAQPGITYRAYGKDGYQGNPWRFLPSFRLLQTDVAGVATNFSTIYRSRADNCGLAFDGLIKIERPGDYNFHLTSDDGSCLYVGKPSVTCRVSSTNHTPFAAHINATPLNTLSNHCWVQLEGEVTYAAESAQGLQLELNVAGQPVPARVIDSTGICPVLLHRRVRLEGVSEYLAEANGRNQITVNVPSLASLEIRETISDVDQKGGMIDTALQVRRLKPEEAGSHIPARIRGVVIYASLTSAVVRDSTGGIYMSYRNTWWPQQPGVGELWEMEGETDAGAFSPVLTASKATFLGYAPMPEPVRPARDQLMNGNLDAEYVELRGVVTAVSTNEIVLLTAEGKVSIISSSDRPLPQLPAFGEGGSVLGSVVAIRGCCATSVDLQSHQVRPGKILIFPASVQLEDTTPQDPFELPTSKPSDLKWFDARASGLTRTKLAGQVIHAAPAKCFVQDGEIGFRVIANNAPTLNAGDLIETVGFSKLGSASPAILGAQVRVTGHAALPGPNKISAEKILDRTLDATLVEITATLLRDSIDRNERVLELQSGPHVFVARLRLDAASGKTLPVGSLLQLRGVYAGVDEDDVRAEVSATPFELLLNNASDIVVLQRPSWWTIRHALLVVGALAGLLCLTFVWVGMLRKQVKERTAQLKKEIEERQLIEQRRAIEQERLRLARDLHDDLGAGLTEVGMLGSLASATAVVPEAKGRYLEQLTNVANSLIASLDEIVWAVNPEYDTVPSLVSYFSLYAEPFLNLAGIKCRLQVMPAVPERPLDSKVRHSIFCAFKETLNNVVRHAGASEVQIVFEVVADVLVISVIDDGGGFEFKPGVPGKDGLPGLSDRMQSLGGECRITSAPGRGTKVELRLPLNQVQHGKDSNR